MEHRSYFGYRLTIGLKAEDVGHLKKFNKFTGVENKLLYYDGEYPYYVVKLNSKIMANDFVKMGIMENKSFLVKPTLQGDINERHYWRGAIDGDGSEHFCNKTKKQMTIELCGNEFMVNGFRDFLARNGIVTKSKIYHYKNLYYFKLGGNKLFKKVAGLLYEDANIYLDRKMKIYEDFKNRYVEDTRMQDVTKEQLVNAILNTRTNIETAKFFGITTTMLWQLMCKFQYFRTGKSKYLITENNESSLEVQS